MSGCVEIQLNAHFDSSVRRWAGENGCENSKFQIPSSRLMLENRFWNLELGTWNLAT